MQKDLKLPMKGIIVPLVTPLLDNDTIDVPGLERLIEHVISGGVHGIFVLGTTGEFAGLGYRLKSQMVSLTCEIVRSRVPVLVGITDPAFSESLQLEKVALECGADAVVMAPPFYFTTSQSEYIGYIKRIMSHLTLPMFLYNMPAHTKMNIEPDTVKLLAKIPGIIGIKDSSSNLAYFNQVRSELHDRRDFSFMVGTEEFMAEFVIMGGHGGVTGGANMFPKLFVDLFHAAGTHSFDKIIPLQEKVMQISTTIYKVGSYGSSYLKGLKCALSVMGICNDFVAEPFMKFGDKERERIEKMVEAVHY